MVAATAVMEAVGGGAPTGGSISAVLIGLAVLLLVAGVVTAFTAGIRGARRRGRGPRYLTAMMSAIRMSGSRASRSGPT